MSGNQLGTEKKKENKNHFADCRGAKRQNRLVATLLVS